MNFDYLSSCWEKSSPLALTRKFFVNLTITSMPKPLGSEDGGIEFLNTSSVTLQENRFKQGKAGTTLPQE
jgi:hypothetical protein